MGNHVEAIDSSAWPVIYARFAGPADMRDFDRFAAWHRDAVDRAVVSRQRLVFISDCRLTTGADAADRKHMAQWIASLSPAQNDAVMLGVIIITRAIDRGILRAIHWLSPPRFPTVVVATLDEAWRKTTATLADAGVARPSKPKAWPTTTTTTTLNPAAPAL